jgi:uncharacterized protein YciI
MSAPSTQEAAAPEQKLQHFFVEITLKGALAQEELAAQRGFLQHLTSQGTLLAAGVLPEVPGRGIAILLARSLEEARAVYAHAPVVVAGKAVVQVSALRVTAGSALQ